MPCGKYTTDFTEFLRKNRDGKCLPSMGNKRDIGSKGSYERFDTHPNAFYIQKKRPEIRGAFMLFEIRLS
jgi:hypothetical protein